MTKHLQLDTFIKSLEKIKAKTEAPKYFMYKDGITVGIQTVNQEIRIIFSDKTFCNKMSVIIEKLFKGQFKRAER